MATCDWTELSGPGENDLAAGAAPPAEDGESFRRRERAMAAIGRRAAVVPEAGLLLQDAAALLMEMLQADVGQIAELPADGGGLSLRLVRSQGAAARTTPVSREPNQSLAGFTLQAGHLVSVPDVRQDSRFSDEQLRRAGVVAALCVPLSIENQTFGALAVGRTADGPFSPADGYFCEAIGHLVSSTTARKQAEQRLADERRIAEGILQTVDALILAVDLQGQITRVNQAAQRLTGFAPSDLLRRTVWSAFTAPRQPDLYREMLEEILRGKPAVDFECPLLTKQGGQKRIAWSWRAMCGAEGRVEAVLLTGLDVTEWRDAQQRAERSRQILDEILPGGSATLDEEEIQRLRSILAAQEPHRGPRIPPGPDSDRRARPRRPYPYHQLIAPAVDGKVPDRGLFQHTPCHDISSGGFSFLSRTPPATDAFVVALGEPPELIYLMSHVAHVTRTEADGQRMYLIGCNYVGRVQYD